MFSSASAAATEIELLKSRKVIGQAVENLKLDIEAKPKLMPVIGSFFYLRFTPTPEAPVAEPLMAFDSYAWGGEEVEIFQLEVPPAYEGKQLILRAEENDGFSLLNDDGETLVTGMVNQPTNEHGFRIQVKHLLGHPGTEFAVIKRNQLRTILDYQREVAASEKGRDSGILSLSLESPYPGEATEILDEVSRLYVRQNVERKSAEAQQSLDFLKDQLPEVRRQLETAETALNDYQASAGSVDITIETQAVLDQVVELETSISELDLKRSEMERRFTRQHPTYQALIEQKRQLVSRRDALLERVGGLPETQQELLRLSRDVEVSTEIYTAMLNKSQELDIVRAGTVGNVRIIDDAVVDTSAPVKPKKALIVVLATLLGGMLGVAIALLRHALNRGIDNPELIEQLGLPVYASVPFSKEQQLMEREVESKHGSSQSSHLLSAINPADLSIESLRSLRTSLHFAMMEAKNNILMISGPSPNVGKSFISANLAAIVAQAGQKVVLIDSDMIARISIHNRERRLIFSPTETSFGKDPAGFGDIGVPNGATPEFRTFLADQIAAAKVAINSLSADQIARKSEVEWFQSQLPEIKDADGNMIWNPDLKGGNPSQLLGYGVTTLDAMPAMGAGNTPVALQLIIYKPQK